MKENEEITNLERFELLIEDGKEHRELYGEFSVGEYDIEIMQHILSDYKKILKENEILKEEKEQAWEEWNNLEQGSYGTEQKLKQQIKELRKENEELKNKLNLKQFDVNIVYNDYLEKLDEYERNNIPKQKVKDKIEHYQKLQHNYIEKYDEINEGLQAMISALQELLGKE